MQYLTWNRKKCQQFYRRPTNCATNCAIMWVLFTLFVTCFVHNVSATVSYGKKYLLDIRTQITHLGFKIFLQQGRPTHKTFSKHPTGPTSPLFARGSDAGTEDKEPDAWSGPSEGEWESCRYRQYYTPTCNHWTIN